jgi:hypothetical protein
LGKPNTWVLLIRVVDGFRLGQRHSIVSALWTDLQSGVAVCSFEDVGWWNATGAVNGFFADAVFVYRVTSDELVKQAALTAAQAMNQRQRAAAVKFVRGVAEEVREQLTEEPGPEGTAHRLEQLASEISLRDSTLRDAVRDRRALDLFEELERVLGNWRAYRDATVFRRLFPNLFNGR